MKALRVLSMVLVTMLCFAISAGAQDKKGGKAVAEVTFTANIHCNNCKKKCDANLGFIKGVKKFKVSVQDKTVWFQYDPKKVSEQQLANELAKLGFPATKKEEPAK